MSTAAPKETEPHYTVSDVAKLLRVSHGTVKTLIRSGRLKAYDANPVATKRQFRITPADLVAFRTDNAADSQRPQKRARRRAAVRDVEEFF